MEGFVTTQVGKNGGGGAGARFDPFGRKNRQK